MDQQRMRGDPVIYDNLTLFVRDCNRNLHLRFVRIRKIRRGKRLTPVELLLKLPQSAF